MNKLLLSLTLAALAWTAQADSGTNFTASTDDFAHPFTNQALGVATAGSELFTWYSFPFALQRDRRIVLTVTKADYESAKDTNITLRVAKVYSQLRTNVEVQWSAPLTWHMSCAVLHPPGEVCEWNKPQEMASTEVTTILKERVAEIEGQQFVLAREVISRTERTFTVKTTTERVYSEATANNPAFFVISKP